MPMDIASDLVEVVQTASVLSRKGFEVAFTLPANDVHTFFPQAEVSGDEIIVKAYLIYSQAVNPHFPFPADPRPLFITHNANGGAAIGGDHEATMRRIPMDHSGDVYLARFPKILLKIHSPDIELRFLFVASTKNNPGNTRVFGCSSPFVIIKDERTAKKVRETRKSHRTEPYPQRIASRSTREGPKRETRQVSPAPGTPDSASLQLDTISYGSGDFTSDVSSAEDNPVPDTFTMAQLPSSFRFAEDPIFQLLTQEVHGPIKNRPMIQPVTVDGGEHSVPDLFPYLAQAFDVGEGEYASPSRPNKVVLEPGQAYEPVGLGEAPVPDSVDHLVSQTRSKASPDVVMDMDQGAYDECDDDDVDGEDEELNIEENAQVVVVEDSGRVDKVGYGTLCVEDFEPIQSPPQQQQQLAQSLFAQPSLGGLDAYDNFSSDTPSAPAAPPAAAYGFASAPPPPPPAAAPASAPAAAPKARRARMSSFASAAGGGPVPPPAPSSAPPSSKNEAASIEETKAIMADNIDKVMERGESIDELTVKSESLNDQAVAFNKTAEKQKKKKGGGVVKGLTRKISTGISSSMAGVSKVLRRKSSSAKKKEEDVEREQVKREERDRKPGAAARGSKQDRAKKPVASKDSKQDRRSLASDASCSSSSSRRSPPVATYQGLAGRRAPPAKPAAVPFSATFQKAVEAERAVSLSKALASLSVADGKDGADIDAEGNDADDAAMIARQAAEVDAMLLKMSSVRIA